MPLTHKERAELAAARKTVAELSEKEAKAVAETADALFFIGLRLRPDTDWGEICREHAKAIRDALEPFDDGERIEVVAPQSLGDVLREADQ